MKRWIKILIVVGILVGALVFFWFIKGQIMSSYLTKKMKVPVSILDIKMRPSYTKISRFHITNPRESRFRTALSAKTILIQYQWRNLFKNPAVIDQIEANHVLLGIDFYNPLGTQNNWTKIIANIKEGSGENSTRQVLIRKLIINDLNVEIHGMGVKGAVLGNVKKKHIDRLEFDNINSQNGFPTKELIQAIFGSSGLQDYIKEILNPENILKIPFQLFSEEEKPHLQEGDEALSERAD